LDEAVSAATVSTVCKILDDSVERYHRRKLSDDYEYLLLDGISVRLRLAGAVQRRMALCAYGITAQGKRELVDYFIVKAEGEDTWKACLLNLYRRGLSGQALKLVATDGQKGAAKAIAYVWPHAAHQRCWVHKLRNLSNRLKRSQQHCVAEAREIYQAPNRKEALTAFRRWKAKWLKKLPKLCAALSPIWSPCSNFLIARVSFGRSSAPPTRSNASWWKCAGAFAPCAPLPLEAPANEYFLAFLTE
jgi:putative transposase